MSTNFLKLNPDKTELLWTGTRHSLSRLTDCYLGWCSVPKLLMLRVPHASSEWHSRQTCVWKSTHALSVEGVFSSYASCDVYEVHSTWKRNRRSYIYSSPARLDYCNCLMAEAPKKWTEKLQRVMNAAAHILTQTNKYDRGLTRILHD